MVATRKLHMRKLDITDVKRARHFMDTFAPIYGRGLQVLLESGLMDPDEKALARTRQKNLIYAKNPASSKFLFTGGAYTNIARAPGTYQGNSITEPK